MTPPDTLLICTSTLLASSLISAKMQATYPDAGSVTSVPWVVIVASPLIRAAMGCVRKVHGEGSRAVDDLDVAVDVVPALGDTDEPQAAAVAKM